MIPYEFGEGLSKADQEKVQAALAAVLVRTNNRRVAVTGRLAFLFYAKLLKMEYPPRPIDNIDLIAMNIADIPTHVTKRAWVAMFKPDYLALKFRPLRKGALNIHIFTYPFPPDGHLRQVIWNMQHVSIVSLEALLAHSIADCLEVKERPVDGKQFDDVYRFWKHVNPRLMEQAWENYIRPTGIEDYEKAWEYAQSFRDQYRHNIVDSPFQKMRGKALSAYWIVSGAMYTLYHWIFRMKQWETRISNETFGTLFTD